MIQTSLTFRLYKAIAETNYIEERGRLLRCIRFCRRNGNADPSYYRICLAGLRARR